MLALNNERPPRLLQPFHLPASPNAFFIRVPSSPSSICTTKSTSSLRSSRSSSLCSTPRQSRRELPNVIESVRYVDQVKAVAARENPQLYSDFLQLLADFKHNVIDTQGVVEGVTDLFCDYPSLIAGFSVFLPPGYMDVVKDEQGLQSENTSCENPIEPFIHHDSGQDIIVCSVPSIEVHSPHVTYDKPQEERCIDEAEVVLYDELSEFTSDNELVIETNTPCNELQLVTEPASKQDSSTNTDALSQVSIERLAPSWVLLMFSPFALLFATSSAVTGLWTCNYYIQNKRTFDAAASEIVGLAISHHYSISEDTISSVVVGCVVFHTLASTIAVLGMYLQKTLKR
ncbi:UNVERIFIED_CONTAM: Transcriptional regulatory protein sin3 [Siphonaria sp. JEL0065]|nr:Transcriptional regulatory protein sin3 [Siphonaria sp. JEL0065]